MAKDEMKNLGFDHGEYKRAPSMEGAKEREGFVAGLGVKGSRWFSWLF